MALKPTALCTLLICSFLYACTPMQHVAKTEVRYETVQSEQNNTGDASINALIAPYKVQIDAEMNEVIGTVAKEMTKRKPESALGNFFVDAMMWGALKEDPEVAFAIANYGGLRVPYLAAGPLTRGQIFELSPFDNLIVIVHMPGALVDSLMHNVAETGGWPVSNEVRMQINDGGLVGYTIKGEMIVPTAIYKVAMPDYLANGGDGFDELIPLDRTQSGKLVRDLIIEHVISQTAAGHKIDVGINGRIVNVN